MFYALNAARHFFPSQNRQGHHTWAAWLIFLQRARSQSREKQAMQKEQFSRDSVEIAAPATRRFCWSFPEVLGLMCAWTLWLIKESRKHYYRRYINSTSL